MTNKAKKILLIDGNSVIHRAFHALPPLKTSEGIQTNAVYGFITMMQKAVTMAAPDYVVVAFDHSKITFRHRLYADYKGTRSPTDPELRPQFALIKRLLSAWGWASCELEDYEADDLIGTLSRQSAAADLEVLILTGDRDVLQLIGERVKVFLMRRGLSQVEVFDQDAIQMNYGLEPSQLIDVMALKGDKSDNIPGVPGIGEKTALRLVRQYGNLEAVLAHIDEIKGRRVAANLAAYGDQTLLAKKLAAICCTAPVKLNLDACQQTTDYQAVLSLYKELEFNSLIKDVLEEMREKGLEGTADTSVKNLDPSPSETFLLEGLADLKDLLARVVGKQETALELIFGDGNYLTAEVLALGLSWEDGVAALDTSNISAADLAQILEALFADAPVYHDAKAVIAWGGKYNVRVVDPGGDTLIAGYLLNPSASRHDLPELCLEHLDLPLVEGGDLLSTATRRAEAIRLLHKELAAKIQAAGMSELYRQVELPLIRVLAAMESYGVAVDLQTLDQMGVELAADIADLTAVIYELAGEEFNINSPKQLSNILFEKLCLPPIKRTKTGFSTDATVLENLASKYTIATKLLEYRQLAKLKSTYVDGLRNLVNPKTGCLHTTFNQTVTSTGRLSSSEPNLQNIPVRLELGRRLRRAFVPHADNCLLLAADYSQIELRVLAHIAADEVMIDAFRHGEDIHARTAAEVFGVSLAEVTSEMRRSAKAVNFGIVYGISDYGLSRDLNITRGEAADYIKRYFNRYAGVRSYMENIIGQAREDGYVTTLLGRRRYLPDIFSSNHGVRSFGERTALNTPIQGSAADIIKIAMINIFKLLERENLTTRILLQVHDELIFDVPEEEMAKVVPIIKTSMESALELRVPLMVDLKWGPNWYDLKPLDLGDAQNA